MDSTTEAVATTEIELNSPTYDSNPTSNDPHTTMSVTYRPTTGFTTNKYDATLSSVNDITTQNGIHVTSPTSNNITTNDLTTVMGNHTMPITTEQMSITNFTKSPASTVYIETSSVTTPYTVGTSETLSNISVTITSDSSRSTRLPTTNIPTVEGTTLSTKSSTLIMSPTDHQTTYRDRTSSTRLPTDATTIPTASSVVTDTQTAESTTLAPGSSNVGLIVGVSFGALALIVIIIVIVVLCRRRKPKRRRSSMDDAEYNYKHDAKKPSASQKNTLPPSETTGLYFQPEVGGWDTSDSPPGLDNPNYDTTGLEFLNGNKPVLYDNENTFSNVQSGVNNNDDDKDEPVVEIRARSILPVENRHSVGLLDMGDDDMSATNTYEKLYQPTSSFMSKHTEDESKNNDKTINPSDSIEAMKPVIENEIDPDLEHNDKPTSEHNGNISDHQDDEMVETNTLSNENKANQQIPSKQITTEL